MNIETILGPNNYNKLNQDLLRARQMAWEQVLIMAIYARSLYLGRNGSHFYSRMKLVDVAEKYGPDWHQYILSLLEKGDGSTAITNEITDRFKVSQEGKQLRKERPVLMDIEKDQIAFSTLDKPLKYSHHGLHKILFELLPILQNLMKIPSPEAILEEQVIHQLKNTLFPKDNIFNREIQRYKTNDLDQILKDLHDKDVAIDKKKLISDVFDSASRYMASHIRGVFELINPMSDDTNSNRNSIPLDESLQFDSICSKSGDKESIELTFNKQHLSEVCYLGGADQLMGYVKSLLLSDTNKKHKNSKSLKIDASISTLSQWFHHAKTDIIVRENQIPKIVAALVDFDIQNIDCGFFRPFSHRFSKDINKTQSTDYTSRIIHNCLYQKKSIADIFENADSFHYPRNNIDSILPVITSELYANNSMFVWADFDVKKAKERMKQCRITLSKHFGLIDSKIEKQKFLALSKQYPVNSVFPKPLWKASN